jgi:broad specificity phosphatase PhoE
MTTLYLARHGQSEWNNRGLVTGQLDVGLSEKGVAQSLALAQCMDGALLDAIYSSALQRALSTARPTALAQGMAAIPLPALNEIHMGQLQGRYRDGRDVQAQALWARWQADPWGFQVPGGEPMQGFAQRVGDALHALLRRHRGGRILIVGHRATNRVLMGMLLAWPRERWGEIGVRNKHLYRIDRAGCGAALADASTFTVGGSKSGQCVPGFVM